MNQVPDRKKLRREYLKRKGKAYVVAGATGSAWVSVSLASVLLFLFTLALILLLTLNDNHGRYRPLRLPVALLRTAPLWLSAILLGVLGRALWFKVKEFQKTLAHLTYVPPVIPNMLPADEILVRGSEEPPNEQSEMLLKAAQKGQETAQNELLRVSQEQRS